MANSTNPADRNLHRYGPVRLPLSNGRFFRRSDRRAFARIVERCGPFTRRPVGEG